MNRLSVRLVLSHVLVAVLGALATFFIVRQLAPALFDETLRRAQGGGPADRGRAWARMPACGSSSHRRWIRPC